MRKVITLALILLCSLASRAHAAEVPCSVAKVRATLYQCRAAFDRTVSANEADATASSFKQRSADDHAAFATCDRAAGPSADCSVSKSPSERTEADMAALETLWDEMLIAYGARQYEAVSGLAKTRDLVAYLLTRDGHGNIARNAEAQTHGLVADSSAELCAVGIHHDETTLIALRTARRYSDLASAQRSQIARLEGCARKAGSTFLRAHMYYRAMVAAEEAGRAYLAAHAPDQASEPLGKCLHLFDVISSKLGSANVPGYMTDVVTLCKGRLDGRFNIDFPRLFDAKEDDGFHPLVIPTSSPQPTATDSALLPRRRR